MNKKRKNKGCKPHYSHNSNTIPGLWHTPSNQENLIDVVTPVKLSKKQISAMEALVTAHENLTGDDVTNNQITKLDLIFRKALAKAQINQSLWLIIDWQDFRYHIAYDWFQQGCPSERLISGLRMESLTKRGYDIITAMRTGGAVS